jgi:2-polyprenyl-3-methyl-5-hydroxy-6-metoxy-1,4-benzoquinol methylase
MRVRTKSLQQSDYQYIEHERSHLSFTYDDLTSRAIRIDVGHPARYWEYGNAINALQTWLGPRNIKDVKILDVGAGVGLLGPTLAMVFGATVLEVDPDPLCEYAKPRQAVIGALAEKNFGNILRYKRDFLSKQEPSDVVFCISTVEHVDNEILFWRDLAASVKPGGLLFMTMDVVPDRNRSYTFDNLRRTNYDVAMIKWRVEMLQNECNMELFGEADFTYHGNMVYDYSFFSVCMEKAL